MKTVTKSLIEDILTKCMSHAQIRKELKKLSFEDRINLLKEKNKLTRLEIEDYKSIYNQYSLKEKELLEELEDEKDNIPTKFFTDEDLEEIYQEIEGEYKPRFRKLKKEYDELLFGYDRRLYENYEISKGDNPIPIFDWEDYVHDRDGVEKYNVNTESGFVDMLDVKLSASRDSIGAIENTHILAQSENVNYTDKELSWLRQYFDDNQLASFLTYKINGREPKEFKGVDVVENKWDEEVYVEISLTDRWKKDFNNIKHHLDNAIDKSEGLEKPTILYHAGRPDPSLLPGDKGVWKGYKSMSFQEQVMGKHNSINDGYWNIIALAPSGVKGVCANDERFRGFSFVDEHEYLLGRNTEYTVVSMDYENHTQIVILDG